MTSGLLRVNTRAPTLRSAAAFTRRDASHRTLRQSFWPHAKRWNGMGPESPPRSRVSDPEHTRRPARGENGEAIALGFHTGHWEVGLLVAEAARELKSLRALRLPERAPKSLRWPHARHRGHDGLPCPTATMPLSCCAAYDALAADGQRRDGHCHLRQGTPRDDDGARIFQEKARRARTRRRHATAGNRRGRGQGADHRRAYTQNQITLEYAAEVGLPCLRVARRRCQFLGTAATSQVVGETLRALAAAYGARPFLAQPVWLDAARRSGSRPAAPAPGSAWAGATFSLPLPFAMRWSCMPRSAVRRICSSISRPSPTPLRACLDPPWPIG